MLDEFEMLFGPLLDKFFMKISAGTFSIAGFGYSIVSDDLLSFLRYLSAFDQLCSVF